MLESFIILAPHIDDETIGCFKFLNAGLVSKVYYFYEATDIRKLEAEAAGKRFGFIPIFLNGDTNKILTERKERTTFLVPNINDSHPDHKTVNSFAKRHLFLYNLRFYSVDMNTKPVLLSLTEQAKKEKALKSLYPSQAKLFENDKFHLFESCVESDTNKMLWVKFQREGIHSYPAALTDPNLKDVSFLGHPHRHIFHFKVSIEIFHADRDIEFIQFKRWLESLYSVDALQLDHKSCEMIAEELSLKIRNKFSGRKFTIEVSEDNENGVTMEYLV